MHDKTTLLHRAQVIAYATLAVALAASPALGETSRPAECIRPALRSPQAAMRPDSEEAMRSGCRTIHEPYGRVSAEAGLREGD